jgi:hypothetical protein
VRKANERAKEHNRKYIGWTVGLIVIMILVGVLMPLRERRGLWLWSWIINLILMFVVMGTVSLSVGAKGGFWAMFVDSRNMVSLSRFQIVLWTLVVLSAFWAIGLARVGDSGFGWGKDAYVCESPAASPSPFTSPLTGGEPVEEQPLPPEEEATCAAPLDLQLPEILWALMGISVTSAVASPLIKENKKRSTERDQPGYTAMLEEALGLTRGEKGEFGTEGAVVYRNPDYDPRFSDMFMGEDPKNFRYVDIAKVQNFFFTVVSVVTYAVALGMSIVAAESISALFQFPDVSDGLLAVLAISHGGYLVTKAAVTPPPSPPPPTSTP